MVRADCTAVAERSLLQGSPEHAEAPTPWLPEVVDQPPEPGQGVQVLVEADLDGAGDQMAGHRAEVADRANGVGEGDPVAACCIDGPEIRAAVQMGPGWRRAPCVGNDDVQGCRRLDQAPDGGRGSM
jgi:hypothetical protein